MAEEAGAPEHARGRLHGVQREPHGPSAGKRRGWIPPASGGGYLRWPAGPARDLTANRIFVEGVDAEGWPDGSSSSGLRWWMPLQVFFPFSSFSFLFETFFLGLISADKVVSVREAGGFIGSERGTGR